MRISEGFSFWLLVVIAAVGWLAFGGAAEKVKVQQQQIESGARRVHLYCYNDSEKGGGTWDRCRQDGSGFLLDKDGNIAIWIECADFQRESNDGSLITPCVVRGRYGKPTPNQNRAGGVQ